MYKINIFGFNQFQFNIQFRTNVYMHTSILFGLYNILMHIYNGWMLLPFTHTIEFQKFAANSRQRFLPILILIFHFFLLYFRGSFLVTPFKKETHTHTQERVR